MDFRQMIKDELQKQGMTQIRLAELADMTIPRVSNYLTGKRDVQGETLRRMLEALQLEVRPSKGRGKPQKARKGR